MTIQRGDLCTNEVSRSMERWAPRRYICYERDSIKYIIKSSVRRNDDVDGDWSRQRAIMSFVRRSLGKSRKPAADGTKCRRRFPDREFLKTNDALYRGKRVEKCELLSSIRDSRFAAELENRVNENQRWMDAGETTISISPLSTFIDRFRRERHRHFFHFFFPSTIMLS